MEDLKKLLELCKKYNLKSFSNKEYQLEFHSPEPSFEDPFEGMQEIPVIPNN